jgi:predicted transcriptional regulator
MLAKDIAIQGFPMLRLEDTASFVLNCMEDFDVQHLPVVKDEYFIGLVSKENVLDMDAKQTIAQLIDPLVRFGIAGSAHFLTALHLFSKHQLTLLPVLNDQQECVGVIPQKNLNDQLAQFLGLDQPGAVIVLSISPLQYSLAEMSRLVETNNAQIVQLNSFFDETNGSMVITIKLNREEASSIIATFQRYDYQVLHYFGNSPLNNDIEDHYHHLMNYLDV